MKNTMIYIAGVIVFALLVAGYARWFERSNIYFPARTIESTPASVGLAFEDIYFETPDGITLNGWFIPAVTPPRATVIFCHGNAGNISHRLDIIRIFNRMGLNVFIFDYRGYGRSRGWTTEEGTYQDALGAYEYLLSRSDVEKDKIVIYGKSLGGNIAIDLAGKTDPRVLISDSTFPSTTDMAKEIYPFLPVKFVITMKYDAVAKAGEINTPKLMIHSREDEIIPFHLGEKLYKSAAEPKEFYTMRGGHNDAIFRYEDEFTEAVDTFLKKNGI